MGELMAAVSKAPPKGVEDLESWVDVVFEELDTDGSGAIDFTEWEAGALRSLAGVSDDAIESAFRAFDVDRSGTISIEEVFRVVDDRSEELRSMFAQCDLNGDGVLDYDEFKMMFSQGTLTPGPSGPL